MSISNEPVHVADRHLEEAQDLLRLVRMTAGNAGEDEWQEARQGLLIVSRQIEQRLADAREAIDNA